MNLRISQGQATRSTFTFSRVTHFILHLLLHYVSPIPAAESLVHPLRTRVLTAAHPFARSRQSIVFPCSHEDVHAPPSWVSSLVDCGPVALRQKHVNLVASGGQRGGVRALFGCDSTELPHRFRVENIDDARVACGNIESLVHAIEKHDIWGAAQRILSQHLPGMRIERDQLTRIA